MSRYGRMRRIQRMDPERDYEEIFRQITLYEFPWDYQQGVSIAFLRDYGIPRISELLDRTQEFEKAGQKRYDDTLLFAYEMSVDGFGSERGKAAARHLNRIHGKYRIPNEDFLYVLATTVVGPKRWIERFGWRPLCANERTAMALVGHRMAEVMDIHGAPRTMEGFERLLDTYEAEMFAYHPANRRVATATFRTMASWYPAPLRPFVGRFSLALLDGPLLSALGFPRQPGWLRALAAAALRTRSTLLRLGPARPRWRPAKLKLRSYPFGYTLDDLGPAWAHNRPLKPLPEEREADQGGATVSDLREEAS
ncbi:oxygenase MpaB family protein [Streptomyces sp. ODS28]|uniref:oxygenase MpaB family protein n=1 Tax=Streptomyces sp. ODS28 TaxID=3136688 RepID=UPI0031E5EB84